MALIPLEGLCENWKELLSALHRNNLHLSPSQTVINPKSTSILGWVWTQGKLSANPHSICTLKSCPLPSTVKQLRSFIGAYKVLNRVIPKCSEYLAPLDNLVAGLSSADKLVWNEERIEAFHNAQNKVCTASAVTLPRRSDKLWIVTDATTRNPGIGATLYFKREDSSGFLIGGFFSAKLNSCRDGWLPCEREALCIASAIKHFQPLIIQSDHRTSARTDSKPCVQAYQKLIRGEFSSSPRVSTFLSACSRFQVSVHHISGVNNALADHASQNPVDCKDSMNCQICKFLLFTENATVRALSVQGILSGTDKVPYLSRSAWKATQLECPDLRRTHGYLKQGTRPSKKITKIKDTKRYLGKVTIAKDGLLVVIDESPTSPVGERIVIPRQAIDGLMASLHLKLGHPTCHQLKQVAHRYFFCTRHGPCH